MDYLAHLRSESARFREVMSGADPAAGVPCCPEWTASDLLWHLAEVQWYWGSIVAGRLSDPDDGQAEKPDRPSEYGVLLDLFDQAHARLVAALDGADEGEPVWTWHPTDHTVGFVRRRQAHEALIHRVDAELVSGELGEVDSELAVDGIDEMLRVMMGPIPDWAHFEPEGASIRLHATENGSRWGVALGRLTGTSPTTGTSYDAEVASVGLDAADAQTAIEGRSASLDLWLWGRAGVEELTLAGDTRLVDRLRALAAESTQ